MMGDLLFAVKDFNQLERKFKIRVLKLKEEPAVNCIKSFVHKALNDLPYAEKL